MILGYSIQVILTYQRTELQHFALQHSNYRKIVTSAENESNTKVGTDCPEVILGTEMFYLQILTEHGF